jgi:hypothetical protein
MMKSDMPIIDFCDEKPQKKEPFRFEYAMPSLDWYEIIKVEIKPKDYSLFKLQRRFDSSWWLIGMNPPEDNAKEYRWTEKEIGRIENRYIHKFIEWAKTEYGGSKIVEISAISSGFDLLREVGKLLKDGDGNG